MSALASPNPVLDLISQVASTDSQATSDVSALMRQQAGISTGEQQQATDAGNAAALVSTTKDRAQLDGDIAAKATGDALGGDITAQSQLITGLSQQMKDSYASSQAALADYSRRKETNFFDDPMSWIGNNVLGGTDQARDKYNDAATSYNDAENRLQGILAATTAGAAAARAMESPITDASIAANATIAKFQYQQVADNAAYKVLGSQIQAIQELQKGNIQSVQLAVQGWQLQKTDEMAQMQLKQLNLAIQDRSDKLEANNLFTAAYTRGMAAFGMPMPDDTKAVQARIMYQSGIGRTELQPIIDAGMRTLTSGSVNFSDTPGQVIANFSVTHPNFSANNQFQAPAQYLGSLWNAYKSNKVNANNKLPQAIADINNQVALDAKAWSINAEQGDSLYKDKGFDAVITANPTLKDTTFYKQVLAPIVTAKTQSMPAQQLLSTTAAAVQAGQLTIEQARDGISQYYQTVKTMNNVANVPLAIPAQQGYMAKTGQDWLFDKPVDISRPEQVTNVLLGIQARKQPPTAAEFGAPM